MKKIKFVFVILHYQALEMTIKSVSQLQKNFDGNENFIVIVDNASPNKSGLELEEKYKDVKNIKVILSKENLGFAKGNNLGFQFAKENLDFDFVLIMNNDVLIEQNDFQDKVYQIYKKTEFDVLGPDIFNPNSNYHQNPLRLVPLTLNDLNEKEKKLKKLLAFYNFYRLKFSLGKIKRKLFQKQNAEKRISKYDFKKEYLNPVLHGSFLIYSKQFADKRNYAFYPETFMFFEEEILNYECKINDYRTFYSPEIHVIHLEDVSTDLSFKSESKKTKWKYREMIKSIEIFKNYIRTMKAKV